MHMYKKPLEGGEDCLLSLHPITDIPFLYSPSCMPTYLSPYQTMNLPVSPFEFPLHMELFYGNLSINK
jgi:hypothetical protein